MKRKITYEIENCFECPFLVFHETSFYCARVDEFSTEDVSEFGKIADQKMKMASVCRWFQSEKCPLEKS